MMVGKNANSVHVIKRMPENSVGAELGVWRGDTSARFLASGRIKHLHLVDTWSVQPYLGVPGYKENYSKVVGGMSDEQFTRYYDDVYAAVCRRFFGRPVTVHRMTTLAFLAQVPEKLDWVYIDASHEYEDVLEDLHAASEVVELIFGDDYGNKPGVKKAVDEFAATLSGWHLGVFSKNQYELRRI